MRIRHLLLKMLVVSISGILIDVVAWAHHEGFLGLLTYISLIALISPLLAIGRDLEEAVELSFLAVVSSILITLSGIISSLFIAVPIVEELYSILTPLIVLGTVHLVVLIVGVTFLAVMKEFLLSRIEEALRSRRSERREGGPLELTLRPIGIVERGLPGSRGKDKKSEFSFVSKIRLFDEFVDGLEGLEDYSHAMILYWFHEVGDRGLKARPFRGSEMEVGVFATRSPHRVNPLGVTVVEILEVNPPFLIVRGLDAWSGSPVVDIKPYNYYDIVRCPKVPEWFEERWRDWRRKVYGDVAPWLGPCCRE